MEVESSQVYFDQWDDDEWFRVWVKMWELLVWSERLNLEFPGDEGRGGDGVGTELLSR